MSRAPTVPGIIDIRSAAILQEYVLMTNPCAPGASRWKRQNYERNLQEIKTKKHFDTARSWITVMAATLIIATVMGIFHATYLLVPIIQRKYDIGIVLIVFMYIIAYMLIIKMTTPASLSVKLVGHRLTVTFGMILFFLGVIVEVFTEDEPPVVWYVSMVLMGIGASFAYTGAMTIVSDLFRLQLAKSLALVSLGTPLGILVFYLVTNFLLTHISYRWTRLILGIIVLLMTLLAQTFNKPRKCGNELMHPLETELEDNNKRIRECVKNSNGGGVEHLKRDSCGDLVEDSKNGGSCLCVCVCDVSLWSDWSFLLWGIVSMIAVMPYLIPYFFLIAYAFEMGTYASISYICWMCFASILARLALMPGDDFTFLSNRIMFQICLIVVGILYIVLIWAETYGWILVWGIAMGVMEGAISVVIPRITLLTIPRQWIVSSWSCILWFHAFSIAIGPLIVVCIWWWSRSYIEAFITIAIIQFIGAIFATLLPNEEDELFEKKTAVTSVRTDNMQSMRIVKEQKTVTANNVISYSSRFANSFRYNKNNALAQTNFCNSFTKSFAKIDQHISQDKNYKCCCPICKKYGCIPGCTPCTPGGLAGLNETGDDPCPTVGLDVEQRPANVPYSNVPYSNVPYSNVPLAEDCPSTTTVNPNPPTSPKNPPQKILLEPSPKNVSFPIPWSTSPPIQAVAPSKSKPIATGQSKPNEPEPVPGTFERLKLRETKK